MNFENVEVIGSPTEKELQTVALLDQLGFNFCIDFDKKELLIWNYDAPIVLDFDYFEGISLHNDHFSTPLSGTHDPYISKIAKQIEAALDTEIFFYPKTPDSFSLIIKVWNSWLFLESFYFAITPDSPDPDDGEHAPVGAFFVFYRKIWYNEKNIKFFLWTI